MTAVGHNQMAVIIVSVALISRLPFHAASGRERDGRNDVGIPVVEPGAIVGWNLRCIRVCLHHSHAEINLHPSESPSARVGEPVDDGGRLRIKRRLTYVSCPDGAGREVWGRWDHVCEFRCSDLDNVVVKRKASYDGSTPRIEMKNILT